MGGLQPSRLNGVGGWPQARSRGRGLQVLALHLLALSTAFSRAWGQEVCQGTCVCDATASCDSVDDLKLQLKWVKQPQFAGYYAADRYGYFAEECLKVTMLTYAPPESVYSIIARGGADVAIGWMPDFVHEVVHKNQDLVHISQIFQRPGMAIMSSPAVPPPVHTFQELSFETRNRTTRLGVQDASYSAAVITMAAAAYLSVCGFRATPTMMSFVDKPCSKRDDIELVLYKDISELARGDIDVAIGMRYNELGVLLTTGGPDGGVADSNLVGTLFSEDLDLPLLDTLPVQGKLSPESASSPFMVTREGSAFVKDSLSDDMYSTVQHQDGGGGGEGAAAGSRAAKHEAYAQALRLEDQVEHMHDHEEPAEAPAAPSPLLGKLDPLPGLGKLPGRGGALEPLAPLRTGMGGGALGSPGGLAPLRNPPGALGILPGAGAGGGGEEEGGLGKSKSSSHVSPRGLGGEEESDVSIGEELEVEDDIVVDDDVSEDSYVFADDQHTSLMSKGQSMDLMASGLSASDRSGELDDNDFMESAEMSSMGL